jgi:hypothetical protein
MRKGILIRVGIDSSYGEWNAPVNPDNGDFVFLPIPENKKHEINPGQAFPYNHFISDLKKFSFNNNLSDKNEITLPNHLNGLNTHLDPDFNFLTYGDNGIHRGKELKNQFQTGDFIVFFAGLKPISKFIYPLYYAIIGFYEILKVVEAKDILPVELIINAHTRKINPNPTDVIIIADPQKSGRLEKSILIGDFRDKSYRVTKELLKEWGDISSKNGFIQRSAVPPSFKNPEKFLNWFSKQKVKLIRRNN